MNLFTFRGSASKFKIMRDVKIGKSEGGGRAGQRHHVPCSVSEAAFEAGWWPPALVKGRHSHSQLFTWVLEM